MKSRIVGGVVSVACLFASGSAQAHFKLEQPADSVTQDVQGNPQKPASVTDMCPAGTASGLVTQVKAGSKLHVKVSETIVHGGHYRVAFAANKATFSLPATVVTNNQCMSTTIQNPAVLPNLADGLFPHQDVGGPKAYETDVTVPNVAPGNYILQVSQWMTPHGSAANNGIQGCFYLHCANLQVVDADAGVADGGVIVTDAGNDSGTPGVDAGNNSSSGGTADDSGAPGTGGGASSGGRPGGGGDGGEGCSVASGDGASLAVPAVAAFAVLALLRGRRKRSARKIK